MLKPCCLPEWATLVPLSMGWQGKSRVQCQAGSRGASELPWPLAGGWGGLLTSPLSSLFLFLAPAPLQPRRRWEVRKDPAPTASKHELNEELLDSWPTLLLSKGSSAWATEQAGHIAAFGGSSEVQTRAPLSPAPTAEVPGEACRSLAALHGPSPSSSTPGAEQREKQYRAHRGFGDRRDGVISARTYFYADEAKCDQHMETFLHCIDASSGSSENGFSAIKLTALGRPQFLLQFSEVLVKWRRFFHQMAAEQGQAGRAVLEMKLEAEKLQEALANLGIATKAESQHWFTGENLGMSGTVDLLDWNSLIDSRTKLSKLLLVPNMQTGQLEPLLSHFTEEEDLQMKRMLQRMDVLAKRATEKGVRLMVDAEQSYFQPAISRLTLEMQRRFNRDQAIIFNTYQCYLKEAYDNVTVDVELSRREGWCFGTKLVRGAYMEQERERAAQIGYEDPINPTYEKTNEMYHRCLDYILEEIKHSRKASVMVASHNEDTVKFTLRRMMELGLHPSEKKVCFGQLLGMCDQITFPLGQAGFPVYKYVPYGPVNEVLPYLSRRAQENRGVVQRANRERDLLWREVKRRLLAGTLFGSNH
uniref:Proline dehydrogenase n=1 Tax=Athene cunicularia TaxID=194338 RepID=A0A663LWK6_ATHCN